MAVKQQKGQQRKSMQVCAHWQGLEKPTLMGILHVAPTRGRETFSFEYDPAWLKSDKAQILDPDLRLFPGPQFQKKIMPGMLNLF